MGRMTREKRVRFRRALTATQQDDILVGLRIMHKGVQRAVHTNGKADTEVLMELVRGGLRTARTLSLEGTVGVGRWEKLETILKRRMEREEKSRR